MSNRMFLPATITAFVLCIAIYASGLGGGYEFDDFPNIVDNTDLHVTSLDPAAWLAAIWSSPSSDFQRPLASLSFAANHYFSGLDPLPMKVTNLAIHILNGWLLFVLLRRLASTTADTPPGPPSRGDWIALSVTALWLIHPINLTAVLYVVQRMESLAQVFVLLGLVAYVRARQEQCEGRGGSARWLLWLVFPSCVLAGVAAKESAAILPLFALVVECTIFRFRGSSRHELSGFYAIFLVFPAIAGCAWLLPKVLNPLSYAARTFTLPERLLTEPRVLMDYLAWIVLPLPRFFSFFRDDYPISTSLWQPASTLPALLGIVFMIAVAFWARNHRPLVSLGIGWFLAAHVLTATVVPLEIAFEHRNYFASAGLLLALVDVVLPTAKNAFALSRYATLLALACLGAFTLTLRAREWSDPVRLAVAEAAQHPHSPRATYALGRTFVVLSGYRPDSPNVPRAIDALEAAARVPGSTILPEVALITVASRTGREVPSDWWQSMHAKLESRRPGVEDGAAIASLTACQRKGLCVIDDQQMLEIYLAGIRHEPANPSILYSYAIFAYNRLHDTDLALRLASEAAKSHDVQYRINLIGFLLDLHRWDQARKELDVLSAHTGFGATRLKVAKLQKRLEVEQTGQSQSRGPASGALND